MHRLLCVHFLRILYIEPGLFSTTICSENTLLSTDRKKSHSSAAASISACHAFFPCPSIAAAITSYRYLPAIRSAALRNIAALSAKGRVSHARFAERADSIALDTSESLAFEYLAMGSECEDGLAWVRRESLLI